MKKLLPLILIIVLAVVVVVQYLQLQRLSPPELFTYALSEDIDLDYHDPVVVGEYYHAARATEAFAHEMWYAQELNVRLNESDDPQAARAREHYTRLLAYADSLGARLRRSLSYKQNGFDNADIIALERKGLSPANLQVNRILGAERLKMGDRNDAVWILQELLIQDGYDIPHDGNFWQETRTAVMDFQRKQQLPVTGVADPETLSKLINSKK